MYLPELHQESLTYLEVEPNYSPRTITAYRSDFRGFADYLRQRDIHATVEAIDRQAVRGYIAGMRQDGLAPASVARRIIVQLAEVAVLKQLFSQILRHIWALAPA